MATTDLSKFKNPTDKRHYLERYADLYNQNLIRGKSGLLPFCFITKDAYSNNLPPEYTASRYGSYPTWGPEETGFRTRSHYVAEPTEKFANIDMYRRPFTNQNGGIVFDHGRPNNGYYLQRNQCKLNLFYVFILKLCFEFFNSKMTTLGSTVI